MALSGTLAANADTCGPLDVAPSGRGSVQFVVTGTITVALQRRLGGGSYITVKKPDGVTDATYTASDSLLIDAPGEYQLLASGVSGGNAVCYLWKHD